MNPDNPEIQSTLHRRWRTILAAFAFATAVGLLLFVYRYLEEAAFGEYDKLVPRFIDEMTSAYTGIFLLVIPVLLARRFPVGRAAWGQWLGAHAAGVAVMSAIHTSLNYVLRTACYALAGLGAYDYGYMPVRYFMELPHDVIAYAIAVGFVHLFDHYRRSRDREVETARLEARLSQAQLQSLRLQIQPHFLFNALNTVSSMIYDDPRAADEMLAKLSEFLRLTLKGSVSQEVPLEEELDYLDLYLDIMRARFGDRLDANFDVDDSVRRANVPQFLLQPLVENAVRHGADPDSGAIRIDFAAHRDGDRLVLSVRDGGPGLEDVDAAIRNGGIGLSNTVDRLRTMYGDGQTISFEMAPGGGLEIEIALPYVEATAVVTVP
ncbi:MAG: histidine kinase [Blastocatellia bacterium]|nr:histidine kinase [Blastocatellia bacterium]